MKIEWKLPIHVSHAHIEIINLVNKTSNKYHLLHYDICGINLRKKYFFFVVS